MICFVRICFLRWTTHTHSVLTYRHLFPHPTERKCGETLLSHMHQFLFIPFLPLTHPSLHSTHSEWSIVEYNVLHECKLYLQSCLVSFELSQDIWYNGLILTRSKLKGNTDPKSLKIFCILLSEKVLTRSMQIPIIRSCLHLGGCWSWSEVLKEMLQKDRGLL